MNTANCLHCNNPVPYRLRRHLKFCNRSCAAKFNNTMRKSSKVCIVCNGHMKPSRTLCCSTTCREKHFFTTKTDPRILKGKVSNRQTLKKYLIRQTGYMCATCNLSSWLGKQLPLELDHKDGNATNNFPSNLRLLCPNCHSITPTWKSKNKGNGRQSHGLRSC